MFEAVASIPLLRLSLWRSTPFANEWRRREGCLERSGVAALDAAAVGSPVDKSLKLIAMLPANAKELSSVEVGGFLAQKRFEAPLDIRALPRGKTIAARGNPVITERLEHPTLPSGQGEPV